MQDTNKTSHYLELVRKTDSISTSNLFKNTSMNSLYWENECLRLQSTDLVFLERLSKWYKNALQQSFIQFLIHRRWYIDSSLKNLVPTLRNGTFAFINKQPGNLQSEIWIVTIELLSEVVFCRISGTKQLQFPQATLRPDGRQNQYRPCHRSRLLHDICNILTLQDPGSIYGSPGPP